MKSSIKRLAGVGFLCASLAGCAQLTEKPEGQTLTPDARAELDELKAQLGKDSDGDGAPDHIEHIAGTDPQDAKSRPAERKGKVPRGARSNECPSGWDYRFTICIASSDDFYGYYSARTYRVAHYYCRDLGDYYGVPARVATHEDLSYIYTTVPNLAHYYNPKGKWIGNIVGDDRVLCGNRTIDRPYDGDIDNFEGTCDKRGQRKYWCAFDLDLYVP